MTDNRTNEPRRLKSCVERWPECETGEYNPSCCRFPKSCSATVYSEEHVTEDDLEPPAALVAAGISPLWCGNDSAHDAHSERNQFGGVNECTGRPNQPTATEVQVEAAAKALHETRNPWFEAYGDWGAAGFEIKQAFRKSARAALVAAQGAAPQAESEDNVMCRCGHGTGSHDFSDPQEPCREIVCDCLGWFGVSLVLPSSAESPVEPFKTWFACWWKNEPNAIAESNAQSAFYAGWDARGLPSSGVDEGALAEVIRSGTRPFVTGRWLDDATLRSVARAVAEWLKGQGR